MGMPSSGASSRLSNSWLPRCPMVLVPRTMLTRSLTQRYQEDRWHWHQAAQGEHRRVQAQLRDHGWRRPGLPQVQDYGQHPQVLLHHCLRRLHEGCCRQGQGGVDAEKKAAVALPASGKCSIPAKELKIEGSFVDFVAKVGGLHELIDTGKGNLQWERDIPPAALSNLEGLANSDFKSNLGKIIHDIYQT